MNRLTILSSTTPLTALRTIRISDNDVTALDLSHFPKLRTLYADRNRLNGLRRTGGGKSRVENLSLRNQDGETLRLRWTELQSVKRLYLSGKSIDMREAARY
jgi:Leucine-rich repeat (LRR) protein